MAKLRALLPAIALAAAMQAQLHAQQDAQQIADPANLMGERVSPQDPADTLAIDHGAPALEQLLRKLRTRASMMLIVAHPDDEDGGLLTYESRGQGARAAMLTLTRGEGGQNLMSADFDDALGLIRTQELLAADRYFGVDQLFGTEVDFGFSKTKEETLAKWTHERVLYDAVRAVRLYRPLVLASVFVGGPTDGHGQHQVAGEIAQEVFLAAADPKVFPEMIEQGLLPWAPLKVYARVPFSRVTAEGMYDYATGKTIPTRFHNYVTGADSTAVPTATVLIHEGEKSTALGMDGDTYLQFARKGLALQKTQIGGNVRLAPAGAFDAGYTRMGSRLAASPATEESLFEGIDTSVEGIATLAPHLPMSFKTAMKDLSSSIARAASTFEATHSPNSQDNELGRQLVARSIADTLKHADALISGIESASLPAEEKFNLLHELRIKRVQLNNALVLAHGLHLEASTQDVNIANGTTVAVNTVLRTTSKEDFDDVRCGLRNAQGRSVVDDISFSKDGAILASGKTVNHTLHGDLRFTGFITRPYFFRTDLDSPVYILRNPDLRNAPATPAALTAWCTVKEDGTRLSLDQVVSAGGQAVSFVPPISVTLSSRRQVLPADRDSFLISMSVVPPNLPLRNQTLNAPKDWKVNSISSTGNTTSGSTEFHVEVPSQDRRPTDLEASVRLPDGTPFSEGYRAVGYSGLPRTNYYTPATTRIIPVDVKTAPGLKVAYLPGTGDTVPDYLPNVGVTPTILTLKDLTPEGLKSYDAVLVGVRAYAAHPELAGAGSKPLLDYARQGGVVILQYMTARYGDAEAPFPIAVPGDSAHNVVEEAQPVAVLDAKSPVLSWPNTITAADFDHWVAERGHGFAASWSPEYTPLLETHDPEQDPQRGGLLYARVGKGAYIYCALALYRQLPEGVPGAYRLLANLLSLAKNPSTQAH